ncbi:hypothetical protein N3762_005461, partial [Escherichia coli]|nr:hypothetical protein [Escherichia coli]
TPYLMVLLLNNDVWCKSREVVVLRNLIEQAWGKVLGEDNSITHLVVYPEVLSLVFDAANTYNAEPGVLEQTYSAAIFLIPICISFDTAEKRRYATYLILNRRFSFEF